MNKEILEEIIEWAETEDAIRSLILVGSRAIDGEADELSDYDVSVFCTSNAPFVESDQWQSKIGGVWVCLPLTVSYNDQEYPTRLIIYEPGVKVDFAFYSTDVLKEIAQSDLLPQMYNAGYKVLLDKDGVAQKMPNATGKINRTPPSEKEFQALIEEFWFEAYHVAKYLKRGDLWSVKFRMSWIYDLLLKIIEWNQQAKHGWNYQTYHLGKNMRTWVEPSTWEELQSCYAHFDSEDSWNALNRTLSLFIRLSRETAEVLKYGYPSDVEQHLSKFIQNS